MTSASNIVHVGYHKTGTTWFQQCLYPNVQSHRYLEDRNVVTRGLCEPHAWAFDPQLARRALRVGGAKPWLICEEGLSGSFETGGHLGALSKEFAGRVRATFPGARIVIFVRHQVDVIASAYLQYVRQGGTHAPERFLFPGRYRKKPWGDPLLKPLFAFEHFEYLGLIRHYQGLFGPENVYVFAFEAFRRNPREFVAEYARTLGLAVDLDGIDYGSVNVAFRHRTLALARVLYLFTHRAVADKRYVLATRHYRKLRRFLLRFDASRFAGRRLSSAEILGPDAVAYVEDFYAHSNRALMAATGLPLDAYGYPGTQACDGADAPRAGVPPAHEGGAVRARA